VNCLDLRSRISHHLRTNRTSPQPVGFCASGGRPRPWHDLPFRQLKRTISCRALAQFALVLALSSVGSNVFAQIYNTGVDNSNQVSGSPNGTELHWYLNSLPNPTPGGPALGPSHTVIEAPLGGWITSSTAQWVGPPAGNGNASNTLPLGAYVYQTKFTLPKYVDPTSVALTGSFASSDGTPSFLTPFTLNHNNASFGPGDNFVFLTTQNSDGHSGVIFDNLSLTYNLLPVPVIDFASPAYKLQAIHTGTPFWFLDGSPNSPLNYSFTATNNPTSFRADGLPPGFSFSNASASMSGTPLTTGTYPVIMTALNSFGFDQQTITLLITDWSIFSANSPITSNQVIVPRAFGNGIYVDVGEDTNTSYTSVDGTVWTTHIIDNSANPVLGCVIFAKGLFVAGGSGGVIYTSADGANWTRQSSGTTAGIYEFAYGNNLILGICSGLRVLTSTDGQNWTVQQLADPGNLEQFLGVDSQFSQLAFGNNVFAVVGNFGIFSTPDGQTWALTEHAHSFQEVAFANGIFLASGLTLIDVNGATQAVPALVTSTQAATWVVIPGAPVSSGFVGGGNVFLANDGNGSQAQLYFSHDGLNWTQSTFSKQYSLNVSGGVSFVNGLFISSMQAPGFGLISHSAAFPPFSTVSFASSAPQVLENAGNALITLTRSGDLSGTTSVLCDTPAILPTTPLNAFANSFAAIDTVDFQSIYQTVTFSPGESTKTVSIPIINNVSAADGRREIAVELVAQSDGTTVGDAAVVSILDDDKSLQISNAENLQVTQNQDKTVSFSATLDIINSNDNATGPLRIKLIADPGYNFFHSTFDGPPPLPQASVIGIFDCNSVSGNATGAVPVSGVVPAPLLNGDGYIFWWVYAQLEEQAGTNWIPIAGNWPFVPGEILLPNGSVSLPPFHHHDSGGAISTPNPGNTGSLPVLPPPVTLSNAGVNGPTVVNKNSTTQYAFTATLSDGSSIAPTDVSWSTSGFSISPTGMLTVGSVKKNTPLTVTATTTVAGLTKAASLDVTVSKSKTAVATPTISPNGGTFAQSVQVTLSDVAIGATIKYSTNGKSPVKKSFVYTGPFTLTSSATVEAIATAPGATNSPITSASFTITP
jgi:hypothetical protein